MAACGGADRGSPEPASGLSEVSFYLWFGPTRAVHLGELTSDGRVRRRGPGSSSQRRLDPSEL
jgi:hypothetical protein